MACRNCENGCSQCDRSYLYNQVSKALQGFNLKNPIPEEVTDLSKLRLWFKRNKYIPYAGLQSDSQHTVLRFINNLATLSPSLGGCISSIGFNCFGGKFTVTKVTDNDFDIGDEKVDIGLDLKKQFVERIKQFDLNGKSWNQITSSLFKSFKNNGNAILQVKIKRSLGVNKVELVVLPMTNCLYLIPDLFSVPTIAVSKSWDDQYLKNNKPEEIPVYPNYSEAKDGTISTIIHIKNGEGNYYGRPDWWPCAYDAFLEIKNKEYLLRASHNNFTGQVLIEYEGDTTSPIINDEQDQRDGYKNTEDKWAKNFTNQGNDPQSVLIAERPKGAAPAFVHEFNINTNEKFYEAVDKITLNKIVLANAWSLKLLGIEGSTGLSNNSFIDDLKTKMPIIEHYQNTIDGIINNAFEFVFKILEEKQFESIGIESKNPFEHLLNVDTTNVIDNNKGSNTILNS